MNQLHDIQLRTLIAAIDRIIPADDFPSASQNGCVEFLLRLIELEDLAEIYQNGLNSLEAEALESIQSFAELSPKEQDQILARCERANSRTNWTGSPREFIQLLARQTIEGYYSDPGNGGNKGETSWKMVGFEVRG